MKTDKITEKKSMSLKEICQFGDCFCFVSGVSSHPVKGKVVGIDFINNFLTVQCKGGTFVVHPNQVKVILTHPDDLHAHIKDVAEHIMCDESPERAVSYLMKKRVDICGYIDAGIAVRNRSTKDVNGVDADV